MLKKTHEDDSVSQEARERDQIRYLEFFMKKLLFHFVFSHIQESVEVITQLLLRVCHCHLFKTETKFWNLSSQKYKITVFVCWKPVRSEIIQWNCFIKRK